MQHNLRKKMGKGCTTQSQQTNTARVKTCVPAIGRHGHVTYTLKMIYKYEAIAKSRTAPATELLLQYGGGVVPGGADDAGHTSAIPTEDPATIRTSLLFILPIPPPRPPLPVVTLCASSTS